MPKSATKPRPGKSAGGRKAGNATTRPRSKKSAKHVPTEGLYGWITHTDLASSDPVATKLWATKVLGWKFKPPLPPPNEAVHLFSYSRKGGGAIRNNNPPEIPGSIPYIHVRDCREAYEKALQEGAEEMLSPTKVMEGVTVAIVRAPGGVPIGFSGP
jgi:predicted enzyme related to lactoylglutathione lyase